METHLMIIGVLMIALASIHLFFPKYFAWDVDLRSLSLINRQMMIVHTFFIGLVVLLMGLLCLTSSTALIETQLGRTITLGIGIFWLVRLLTQLFVFSSKLWKGKRFESIVHVTFLVTWTYFSTVFIINSIN